eukprot:6244870-Alexandrium_andersonii.AAC.1
MRTFRADAGHLSALAASNNEANVSAVADHASMDDGSVSGDANFVGCASVQRTGGTGAPRTRRRRGWEAPI